MREAPARPAPSAARKRAAVETIAREGAELKRVARRFSICAADADDAYQRALEILLLKAPSDRPRELGRWMRTVVKREALAVRAGRERVLGTVAAHGDGGEAAALSPAPEEGPEQRAEELEDVARSREALRRLRPAELRALALLAAGCSYDEIAAITGFSRRKVSRCLVEGRERFRHFVTRSEDGGRCAEMRPLLSAFGDSEASPEQTAAVREHLRACAGCRATLRAYRAAPGAAAALAPALPASRSLLERLQEIVAGLAARLPGGGAADAGAAQVAAAGGGRGLGMAATAKLLALCAGSVGGAACVATGVAPAPLDLGSPPAKEATAGQAAERPAAEPPAAVDYEPAEPPPAAPAPERPKPAARPEPAPEAPPVEAEAGAVEYEPPPPAAAPLAKPVGGGAGGDPAGEFGP